MSALQSWEVVRLVKLFEDEIADRRSPSGGYIGDPRDIDIIRKGIDILYAAGDADITTAIASGEALASVSPPEGGRE